ncbi:MAG: RNA-binding protein, partial [Firmicutes bacterium]|nr:RNA-binding protein [Bacillota bacterium]
KEKKIMHLDPRTEVTVEIKEKLITGKQVFDAEIRKSLRSLGY